MWPDNLSLLPTYIPHRDWIQCLEPWAKHVFVWHFVTTMRKATNKPEKSNWHPHTLGCSSVTKGRETEEVRDKELQGDNELIKVINPVLLKRLWRELSHVLRRSKIHKAVSGSSSQHFSCGNTYLLDQVHGTPEHLLTGKRPGVTRSFSGMSREYRKKKPHTHN